MSNKDKKEVAYHEAGHTVVGYLFYPPVDSTIVPSNGFLGVTHCELPLPLFYDEFVNEFFFPLTLKVILYSWSGEYFQRKISKKIDPSELRVDKESLSIYFDYKGLVTIEYFKEQILAIFFGNEMVNSMVDDVANELLKKETLNQFDVKSILSKYDFDYDKQIELIMDELFLPMCSKYKEYKS